MLPSTCAVQSLYALTRLQHQAEGRCTKKITSTKLSFFFLCRFQSVLLFILLNRWCFFIAPIRLYKFYNGAFGKEVSRGYCWMADLRVGQGEEIDFVWA